MGYYNMQVRGLSDVTKISRLRAIALPPFDHSNRPAS